MKTQTIALWTAGAVATLGLGYIAYFDYQRRSDPDFRRKLKQARKKAAKSAKQEKEVSQADTINLIESVILETSQENFPTTAEEREKYFMEQVSVGEGLTTKGEAFYNEAVLPFYKALKVYPAPMELMMIYQKTIPNEVFQIILNILSIEQQAAEAAGASGQAPAEASTADPEDIPIE